MTRASWRRPSRMMTDLSVSLALWSATPAIEWCSIPWSEVTADCLVPCVVATAVAENEACGPCPSEGTTCDAATESGESGRAFCLHGPVGGSGVFPTSPLEDGGPVLSTQPVVRDLDLSPPASRSWTLAVDVDVGPQPARGERPPIRAPPAS